MKITRVILAIAICALIPYLQACAPAVITGAAATTAVIAGDRRELTTILADQAIELKINDAIYSNYELGTNVHVNAISYNRVLLLTGEAFNENHRDQIDVLAHNIEGVKKIYNEIEVTTPSSFESRSADSWLTTNVKSWISRKSNIRSSHMKVVTERGNVYLMGLVTEEEADIAVDIARRVEDVNRVIKAFEYPGEFDEKDYQGQPTTTTGTGVQTGETPADDTAGAEVFKLSDDEAASTTGLTIQESSEGLSLEPATIETQSTTIEESPVFMEQSQDATEGSTSESSTIEMEEIIIEEVIIE